MKSSRQILKKLISFSVPLILSGLLQQLFNWVDALIVGNVIGERALAGIGATSSLVNMFITVIVGFTSGLSILFAQQFGKGEQAQSKNLLAVFCVTLGAVFTLISAVGMVFSVPLLKFMNMPENVFDYAKEYLVIIFAGIPFLAVYNTYSAALRGRGNSKVPFISVLISSVVNGILDYVFIALLGFGVRSAALATVVSQAVMTIYIICYTVKKCPDLRFSMRNVMGGVSSMKTGAKYALPPAVQSSVSSVGSIILQQFMNSFGEQTVAAITTAYRVDSVLMLPTVNLSTAIATLVAQETGAGNSREAEKTFHLGMALMAVMSVALTIIIILTGKTMLSLFGLTRESTAIGDSFFKTISLFYVIFGAAMSIRGYLEGISDMLFAGIISICSLGVRICCSYAFEGVFGNMVIAYAEAFSWVFMLMAFALRYFYKKKSVHSI